MRTRPTESRRARTPWMGAALSLLIVAGAALGQGPQAGAPQVSESVRQAMAAPYLTEAERAALRVEHGLQRDEDMQVPVLRARVALLSGVYDDPSLDNPDAAVEDRAEARLLRGDLEEALETLAGASSVRAKRIRAEALEGLGRYDEADAAVDPVISDLTRRQAESASELVEGVRALMVRARVRGQPAEDYQRMLDLLGVARERLDRLNLQAPLTEAALLYEKDNRAEAFEAAAAALSLNPSAAGAWAMLGRLAVDGFDFDRARDAAAELDRAHKRLRDDADAVSAEGAEIRALAWLRQNEPDLAVEEIAPVLERFPHRRRTLAILAAVRALQWDREGLESVLEEYERLSPGAPEALYSVGRALAEVRQYGMAADYLEAAIARQPNWPAPAVELGLLELQSGRDVRALDALRRARTLDPFNLRAMNSLRLIEELLTYETVESEHFIVRFRPGVDRVMARDMLEPLEAIHRDVAGAIQHEPAQKTVIDLMPDHEWFGVRIAGVPAIHTIAASTGPVIAMEAPKVGPRHQGEYDWARVIRHEYVHTVTLSRTRNRIPHWFTEAAAVHLEGGPVDFDAASLLSRRALEDDLFDMREINIAFVRPERPTDRSQAYAQGRWMYEFIIDQWGEDAPLRLMDLYAEGVREDAAMRRALGISQEEFFERFKPWAMAEVRAWGMAPEPRVRALVIDDFARTEAGRTALAGSMRAAADRFAFATTGWAASLPDAAEAPAPTDRQIDDWLEAHPDHPGLLALRIERDLALTEGQPTPSMRPLLERYAAARPVDPMPHRLLARLELSSDAPEDAIPHLEALDVREQRTSAYAIELARRYAAVNDLDRAMAKAERATQIAPFDAGHREFAARVALLAKDVRAAERQIEALTMLEPDRPIHQKRLEQVRKMLGGQSGG